MAHSSYLGYHSSKNCSVTKFFLRESTLIKIRFHFLVLFGSLSGNTFLLLFQCRIIDQNVLFFLLLRYCLSRLKSRLETTKMPLPRVAKPRSVDPGFSSKANPFDSDSEGETNARPGRASSVPPISKTNPNQYKNDFRDSGGFDNQSVQELENYAAYKAEETTHKVNDCLKIAEIIKEDATKTLVTLHQQGEQITRTHQTAADIEHDLSRV